MSGKWPSENKIFNCFGKRAFNLQIAATVPWKKQIEQFTFNK